MIVLPFRYYCLLSRLYFTFIYDTRVAFKNNTLLYGELAQHCDGEMRHTGWKDLYLLQSVVQYMRYFIGILIGAIWGLPHTPLTKNKETMDTVLYNQKYPDITISLHESAVHSTSQKPGPFTDSACHPRLKSPGELGKINVGQMESWVK